MHTSAHLRHRGVATAWCLAAALLLTALTWTLAGQLMAGPPAAGEGRASTVAQVLLVGDPAHPGRVRLQDAAAPAPPDAVPAVLRLPAEGATLLGTGRASAALALGGVLVLVGAVAAAGAGRTRGTARTHPVTRLGPA